MYESDGIKAMLAAMFYGSLDLRLEKTSAFSTRTRRYSLAGSQQL
jgi:hypothetical protein